MHGLRSIIVSIGLAVATAPPLTAQGTTTGAISGQVHDDTGQPLESAEVQAVNRATGYAVWGLTRSGGRYTLQGLAVGGPYRVSVRRIGFGPQVREGILLGLGEDVRVDFELTAEAITVAPLKAQAAPDPLFSASRTGTATTITDTSLRRLPTATRDLYSFVRLAPQIISWYGLSGGGVNTKFNGIQIDGVSEQALYGTNAAGAVYGGKAISVDAVQELQVLLSPFDLRKGTFAGALINAVTRSGTNEWRATGYYYYAGARLARDVPLLSGYERSQFGGTLGGPIARNRVHVFLAPEFQRLSAPAAGPFVGQDSSSGTPLTVDTNAVRRFERLLDSAGVPAGSAGRVTGHNPLTNLLARVDVTLPGWHSRLAIRHNYSRADSEAFARPSLSPLCTVPACFPLSSVGRHNVGTKHATAVQLFTTLPRGPANELLFGRTAVPLRITPNVQAPLVRVAVPGGFLEAGSIEFAQTNTVRQETYELTDNATFPAGAHRLTVGLRLEETHLRRAQLFNSYGSWSFANLDSLARGVAESYSIARDLGSADVSLREWLYAAYVEDQWQPGHRTTVVYGLRLDVPVLIGRPPYQAAIDSIFGRRTDALPSGRVQWSPRIGFHVTLGDGSQQVQGGAGLFVGRPPLSWLIQAYASYGVGTALLNCGKAGDPGPAPPFDPDYRNPPLTCRNGQGIPTGGAGPVYLVAPGVRFPQTARVSLAYDRRLPWSANATIEALYTHDVNGFLFVNRNLAGPVGVDLHGRILYGPIDSAGSHPDLVAARFPQVIELRNLSRGYAYALTAQLEKRFSNRVEAGAAYTYSRTRDVQTQLYVNAVDNWQYGRVVSDRHEALEVGVSDFDQPHRVVLRGTVTLPWRVGPLDVSFYYLGGSGFPYTYTASLGLHTGDLNADGSNANDPIYVPRSTTDGGEIQFAGSADSVAKQQAALDRFIEATPCLRRQRGRIMQRNSCRSPWVHTTSAAVRQWLPRLDGHALALELQVFNLLNLLNQHWGLVRIPTAGTADRLSGRGLLKQTGQTPGPNSQPVFYFDPQQARYGTDTPASYYQIQVSARFEL